MPQQQILSGQVVGGGGGGSAFCGANVYRTANVSNSGSSTPVDWDAEHYDTDAIHDTLTNTSQFVVPTGKAGYWRVSGVLSFFANAVGERGGELWLNGGFQQIIFEVPNNGANRTVVPFSVDIGPLSVGDYLEVAAGQTSGGSLNILGTDGASFAAVEFMGA